MTAYFKGDLIPTRDAYGHALCELGETNPAIVVFEADIGKSTRSSWFGKRFPERYFNVGVAEQNEMAAAAGAAMCGMVPFVSTYAVFASMRACEQIRTFIAYPRLNVKICPSHGGITPANDGVTHQATEDIGMMRVIPGMTVIMPADAVATGKIVKASAAYPGPVYIRLTRDAVPVIYPEDAEFEIGKSVLLRAGSDVSLIATGDMVCKALEAAGNLEKHGVKAEVIDMHTVKPLDEEAVLATARKTGAVVTVEDHQVQCGLGGAVCEFLCGRLPTPVVRVGLQDSFAESGEYELLLRKYHFGTEDIEAAAMKAIRMQSGDEE